MSDLACNHLSLSLYLSASYLIFQATKAASAETHSIASPDIEHIRPQPHMAAAESSQFAHLSPTHPARAASCSPHAHQCRWWPYSNSNDFGANTAVILIIFLCALISALILNAAIRCFLRGARHLPDQLPQTQRELVHNSKPSFESGAKQLMVAPIQVYAIGMKLGGVEADCAICLSEFVEGEGIRVLGSCKHGFNVHCIEKWLSSHSSCPTCRSSCLASFPTSDCM